MRAGARAGARGGWLEEEGKEAARLHCLIAPRHPGTTSGVIPRGGSYILIKSWQFPGRENGNIPYLRVDFSPALLDFPKRISVFSLRRGAAATGTLYTLSAGLIDN